MDQHDVLALVGLALVAAGLWLLHPSAALIGVGATLLLAGVRGARRAAPSSPPQPTTGG